MNFDPLPWLQLLVHQTLALSLGLLVILVVRGPLIRRFGAAVAYAAWVVLPLLLAAASLPASESARALRAQVMTRIEPLVDAAAPLPELVQPTWPWVLAGMWLVGAVLCTLRMVWLQRRFMSELLRREGDWQGPEGSGPALVGLLHPRLVLPADFEQRFDADQRTLVLAHEAVHRARADNHWNALAAALCLLHWFNPLAWLALRRMRVDQELACDAAVMAQHSDSHAAYARALLLAHSSLVPAASLPWASWQTTHPLVERIAMLKNSQISTRRRVVGYALLAGLAVAGVGVAQVVGAQSTTAAKIELNMDISLREQRGGGPVRTRHISQIVNVAPGQRQQMMLVGVQENPTSDQVAIEIWADDIGDSKVLIEAELKRGLPLVVVSHPRLITKSGLEAKIEIGRKDVGDNEMLSISVTPTLLKTPKT